MLKNITKKIKLQKYKTRNLQFFSTNDNNNNTYSEGNTAQYPDVLKYFFENNIKTKKLPCFEVYSSQIEILNQPMDFYLAIIVYKN